MGRGLGTLSGLAAAGALLAATVGRWWQAQSDPGTEVAAPADAHLRTGLGAQDAGLVARLIPLHADPSEQRFAAGALAGRLGLGPGEPWRLELQGGAGDGSADVRVVDALGVALTPPALGSGAAGSPLSTLLGAGWLPGGDGARARLLWGRAPGEGARLEALGRSLVLLPLAAPAVGRPGPLAVLERAAGDGASAEEGAELDLAGENERLRAELAHERERRLAREQAWHDYNRSISELGVAKTAGSFAVDPAVADAHEATRVAEAPAEAASEPPAPDHDPLAQRLAEIQASLRALCALADLASHDLLEIGTLRADGLRRGVGPVVFRLLDDRGRLVGSLCAELLRLEGSRSGRTVSLVLEDGYESRGGERVPFADGERRIAVPFLDPEPWYQSCPELFPEGAFAQVEDDGSWDREELRRELNRLLALDTEAGWYRVRGIGGVVRERLTDVQLEVLDASGKLTRRLFADRLRLEEEPPGIVLVLEDGVILRGEEKEAFRDGTHRIYLPRARAQDWRAAGLPGLTQPPAPSAGEDERQG